MRNLLTIAFISIAAMGYAQSPSSNTGANVATVNIILNDIQTVIVAPGQTTVDLIYNSKEDYEDGVSETKTGHLQVFSTKNYQLKSAVWQDNLITQYDISINGVLQTRTFQTFHIANAGSLNLDIEYAAKGNNDYLDKNKQTYTTQVIYSIEPQ